MNAINYMQPHEHFTPQLLTILIYINWLINLTFEHKKKRIVVYSE